MISLLNNIGFIEQLLRSYLKKEHQTYFKTEISSPPITSTTPIHHNSCTLVANLIPPYYPTSQKILWLELAIAPNSVFINLYEFTTITKPISHNLPTSSNRIVTINIHDPNGCNTMQEIIEDKLCELSTTFQNQK